MQRYADNNDDKNLKFSSVYLQAPTMTGMTMKYLMLLLVTLSSSSNASSEYCEPYCSCQEGPLISVTCINADLKVITLMFLEIIHVYSDYVLDDPNYVKSVGSATSIELQHLQTDWLRLISLNSVSCWCGSVNEQSFLDTGQDFWGSNGTDKPQTQR